MIKSALIAGVATLALCGPVLAQAPAAEIPDSPRFEITRFEVAGNTLLQAAEINAAVASYTGKQKDFSDIQRALESLEQVYRDRGYGVVQVSLPEQDITQGVVRLRVVEARIGRVVVEGNKVFSADNIRRSLPSVKEGAVPNTHEIARDLQLAAEHPVKQTQVTMRSGAAEDLVDVAVKVVDDKPARVFLTLDNTGNSDTGYYRAGIGYQHANLFDRDHTLTAQYTTSPTNPGKVTVLGAGYRIPFYGLHGALDLIAGYSDVNSGTVQGLFNVSGQGAIGGAYWSYYLPKWGEVEQKLKFGLDYRAFSNQVLFQGQGLVPDITVHPASVTYSGLVRTANSELSFNGGLAANIPGGNDGKAEDFQRSRAAATANYVILRYGLSYLHQISGGWQARALFNGQYTGNALVAGEQFGVGGPDSVRGYLMREVVSDRGYSAQLELYTPDLSKRIGLSESYKTRLVAFYDFGEVKRNLALAGESSGDTIASAGLGARVGYGKSVNMRLDVARIQKPTANRETGSVQVGASLVYIF